MHKLVIKSKGPHTKDTELYLDDLQLSGVRSYELVGEVAGVHTLRLELIVQSVNEDSAILQALVTKGAIRK